MRKRDFWAEYVRSSWRVQKRLPYLTRYAFRNYINLYDDSNFCNLCDRLVKVTEEEQLIHAQVHAKHGADIMTGPCMIFVNKRLKLLI